jgi:hypothetical protein
MQKMIEIEKGRSLNFKASAFSPILYNRLFTGRDFLKDMEALREAHEENKDGDSFKMSDYEHFARIAYLFAYQGLAPTPRQTPEQVEFIEQYPNTWIWIDSFNTFSIYEILPEIMELWYNNEKQISKGKNAIPAPPGK